MMEKTIRTAIVKHLKKSYPNSEWEVSPPNSPTAKADITGCIRWNGIGRYVAIEVKRPGFKPRRAQRYKLDRLRAAGAVTLIAQSVEDVKEYLPRFLG